MKFELFTEFEGQFELVHHDIDALRQLHVDDTCQKCQVLPRRAELVEHVICQVHHVVHVRGVYLQLREGRVRGVGTKNRRQPRHQPIVRELRGATCHRVTRRARHVTGRVSVQHLVQVRLELLRGDVVRGAELQHHVLGDLKRGQCGDD